MTLININLEKFHKYLLVDGHRNLQEKYLPNSEYSCRTANFKRSFHFLKNVNVPILKSLITTYFMFFTFQSVLFSPQRKSLQTIDSSTSSWGPKPLNGHTRPLLFNMYQTFYQNQLPNCPAPNFKSRPYIVVPKVKLSLTELSVDKFLPSSLKFNV